MSGHDVTIDNDKMATLSGYFGDAETKADSLKYSVESLKNIMAVIYEGDGRSDMLECLKDIESQLIQIKHSNCSIKRYINNTVTALNANDDNESGRAEELIDISGNSSGTGGK